MRKYYSLIALLFVVVHSYGQFLSGRIIHKSGSPEQNATVINITRLSTCETDNDGRFSVRAEYGDSFLISTFRDKKICVYQDKMHEIVLEELSSLDQPQINDKVINQINTLYLSEKYIECIRYCSCYLAFRPNSIILERHPYRDWGKKNSYFENSDIESIAKVLYLGCISAYKYSLSHKYMPFEGLQWCRAYIAFYDDYLKVTIPDDSWSAEMMNYYITYGKWANNVILCGEHFLHVYDYDERWVRQQYNWYSKKRDKFLDVLYSNTYNKESKYSEYPFLEYEIGTIIYNHILKTGNYKYFKENYYKRFNAVKKIIQESNQVGNYSFEIYDALNSLTTLLSYSVVDKDLCKKVGENFERFCMEELIKLQDVSYYLNGSSRYSLSTNYNLNDIQNHLKDGDCAMIHFEAPTTGYYNRFDLGSRYRNYALIITKNQERPDLWHRGYINDSIVNDFSKIKEYYPKSSSFYVVGTPRMSFVDIAQKDSSIVRLHSLSQLLQERNKETTKNEITFIGDLNYGKVGDISSLISERKGGKFGQLIGSAKELVYINTLFPNVRPINGDNATKNLVTSEISRSNGIVHISTHGELLSSDINIKPEDLILKRNVMDNSRLILSGYNDAPNSSLSYMSGSDVLKMKRINSSIVFLDACLSGKGAVGVSGSVGIAEAFHLIGAKNVICFLESVEDDVATEFSNRFYLELSKGKSCHEAFFIAKNSMSINLKAVLWE